MAYKHRLDLTMGMPKGMNRMDQFPLDMSSVYYDYTAMETYAKTSAIAYVGQPLSLVDEENKVVTLYTIQDTEGTLKKVGTSPIGDESTITVAEDGTVSLFGIEGLELEREVEGEVVKINYQPLLVDGKLTWVEPSATTVEGLATEIEGIKSRLSSVETVIGKPAEGENEATGLIKNIDDITANLAEVEANIGTVQSEIDALELVVDTKANSADVYTKTETYSSTEVDTKVKEVADLVSEIETDIETLNGNDTVDGSIDKKIKDAINTFSTQITENDTIDTYAEILSYIAEHGGEASEMMAAIDTLEGEMDTVQGDIADLKIAMDTKASADDLNALTTSVSDLDAAYKAADEGVANAAAADAQTKATAAETAAKAYADTEIGKVQTALDEYKTSNDSVVDGIKGAEKNVIASVDTTQFNIDENRKLTLLDVSMDKVTGLNDALAGKVSTQTDAEGNAYTLLSPSDKAKLDVLVINDDGTGVEISGKVNASNVEGLADWITNNSISENPVPGLSKNNLTDDLLNKLNGIAEGAEVNVIDSISVNGVDLAITDKKVNIGLATTEIAGVVKSSSAENKVAVSNDGTMEVNNINVNKLVQTAGDSLILNGGSATV